MISLKCGTLFFKNLTFNTTHSLILSYILHGNIIPYTCVSWNENKNIIFKNSIIELDNS